MKTKGRLVVFGLAGLLAGSAFLLQAQEKQRTFESALSTEQFERCGLNKLTANEQQELFSSFAVGPMPSFAQEGAKNYMLEEGWRLVRIVGAVETDDHFDPLYPVVWDNYRLYTLDPFSTKILPEPGIYWAKNVVSSWTILYADGSQVSFSAKEIE